MRHRNVNNSPFPRRTMLLCPSPNRFRRSFRVAQNKCIIFCSANDREPSGSISAEKHRFADSVSDACSMERRHFVTSLIAAHNWPGGGPKCLEGIDSHRLAFGPRVTTKQNNSRRECQSYACEVLFAEGRRRLTLAGKFKARKQRSFAYGIEPIGTPGAISRDRTVFGREMTAKEKRYAEDDAHQAIEYL